MAVPAGVSYAAGANWESWQRDYQLGVILTMEELDGNGRRIHPERGRDHAIWSGVFVVMSGRHEVHLRPACRVPAVCSVWSAPHADRQRD
jgi:hypothetical protein